MVKTKKVGRTNHDVVKNNKNWREIDNKRQATTEKLKKLKSYKTAKVHEPITVKVDKSKQKKKKGKKGKDEKVRKYENTKIQK